MNHMQTQPADLGNASPPNMAATPGKSQYEAAAVAALVLLAVVILWWRWVGYQGHDDIYYAWAALDWAQNFPALGTSHWALRYPLVIPAGGVIALFGPSVLALASVNLVAYAGFLVVHYLAVRHWFDWPAAALAALACIILPQFPVQATYANPDLLEMALVMGSFWALMLARERGASVRWLFLSGVLAGLGFLTRETTLALLVLYGVLFLFRPGMMRWRYLVVGAGFLLVVGAQLGYFAVRAGDPLHRIHLSATHDRVDRSAKPAAAAAEGRALDSEGVLVTSPLVAPLAAIFVSQKYGLLFFLAIPAAVALWLGRALTARQRQLLNCVALGAAITFLFVALNATILYVVPRYFMVPAALATVPLAVQGARWLRLGGFRRAIAALLGLGFVATSILLLYLENTRPMLVEERIVEIVAASGEVVHVDPDTNPRLNYLLLVRGLEARVTAAPPEPGALVVAKDGVVAACVRNPACPRREAMLAFVPDGRWSELSRLEPPRRAISTLLRGLGLAQHIPQDILRKIEQPGVATILYRVN